MTLLYTHSVSTCPGHNWLRFPGGKGERKSNNIKIYSKSISGDLMNLKKIERFEKVLDHVLKKLVINAKLINWSSRKLKYC